MRTLHPLILSVVLLLLGAACGDSERKGDPLATPDLAVLTDGRVDLVVVIPQTPLPGLGLAAEDLLDATRRITGAEGGTLQIGDTPRATGTVVLARLDPAATTGEEGYSLLPISGKDRAGIEVVAATPVGLMYGIHDITARLGVLWIHPEETFWPSNPALALPTLVAPVVETPRFAMRGFHEHTQHPIEFSDFHMRPNPEWRPYLSRYIRWYARNRQNAMSWHMLKTVDVEPWIPWVSETVREAHDHGIRVGMVVSFADQQQNNFKVIPDDAADQDAAIRDTLASLARADFDFLTFQIGSSEFTKPPDTDVLRWMQVAVDTLSSRPRPIEMFTWIHTTCDLEADDGSLFYHLPLRADPRVGAWPHTTMFYNLVGPAPVYGCETFGQQLDFIDDAEGERRQVYFPESAWWLGFDNNMPVSLPLTGLTRERDIREVLDGRDVDGHVTFTTGREWGYWQYDHYLAQVTWDGDLSWAAYLDRIAPVWGVHGQTTAEVLRAWTEQQDLDFQGDNPEIYFYVAGELALDEIGQQAGILARRPKIAFRRIVEMSDAEFDAWRTRDLDHLRRMETAYAALFARLPAPDRTATSPDARRYDEVYTVNEIFVLRVRQAIAHYAAVAEARAWAIEKLRGDDADTTLREARLTAAEALRDEARAITEQVRAHVARIEGMYRYPIELLAREKPETLTVYPFGYLWHTHTVHFWERRDRQLDQLLGLVFDTAQEEWSEPPTAVRIAAREDVDLTEPDSPLARSVLTGFMPQFLFGVFPDDTVHLAQDFNTNGLPDVDSETAFARVVGRSGWVGAAPSLAIVARNSAGDAFGELIVEGVELVFPTDSPATAESLVLTGAAPTADLGALIGEIAGLDEEAVTSLLKSVFGVPRSQPLPQTLPVRFEMTLRDPPQP